MDTTEDIKKQIKDSLHACGDAVDFAPAANAVLSALGYVSERMEEVDSEPKAFVQKFRALNSKINTISEQEFVAAAKSVHLLFQSGEAEIQEAQKEMQEEGQNKLPLNFGKGHVDKGDIKSFLFLAVDLKKDTYRRGDYAAFTREINKRFLMPSVVLFRCGNAKKRCVTLSFVWRRVSKTDPALDVLGRVSLLREIGCYLRHQHRGHLDILEQLTLKNRLFWMKKKKVDKFEGLLAAWLNELDAEALNQRFYEDLCRWFDHAVENAKFPTNRKVTTEQQVVRMISRLLFIWFMKEKGLVSEHLFDEERMREVLVDYDGENDGSYYRAILQNLFFATLNTDSKKRDFSDASQKTHRISTLYRYKDLMLKPDDVRGMMEETPFVNGGLFDCLDDFESTSKGGERIDCFTDNETQRKGLHVPNFLFFGEKGVFDIFEKYKFTVEENTPIEQEVALDPELLGKVFENLLTYIDRKETGSFYTPRIIVDYMVRESLVAYFVQTIETDKENLKERIIGLLSAEVEYETLSEDKKLSKDENEKFVTAVGEVRLLDPAVGSGAFPMGALQQMTMALKRADFENIFLKERELEIAERFEDSRTCEKAVEMVKEIFSKDNDYNDYGRKLALIRDCLFGVDVQTVAVQICRLRFFISLLIEQPVDKEKEDFGIRPLPNIDARIIAADTLMRLDESSGQHDLYPEKVRKLRKKLWANRRRFFSVKTRQEKIECRQEDKKIRYELAAILVDSVGKESQKIADWDLYDQNSVADWFNSTWMFEIEKGFNIVIGNPPYVRLQRDNSTLAKRYSSFGYDSFVRSGDIYCLFYERGMDLLQQGGHLCYITSNRWMQALYGEKLRKLLATKNPLLLIDLGAGMFESAAVDTNILMIQNAANSGALRCVSMTSCGDKTDIASYVKKHSVALGGSSDTPWFIGGKSEVSIKKKIESIGLALGHWKLGIFMGIKTGFNHAFEVDKIQRTALLNACADDEERKRTDDFIQPFLRGEDITHYAAKWAEQYLIVIRSGWTNANKGGEDAESFMDAKFPALMAHFRESAEIDSKGKGLYKRVDQGDYWWELRACKYYEAFERKDKIVWSDISTTPSFSILRKTMFFNNTAYMILGGDISYLTGVLNSSVIGFYFPMIASGLGDGATRYFKAFVENIPVPRVTPENRETVEHIGKLADKITAHKEANPKANIAAQEDEVNKLVYKLYNLTNEEVSIIEGANQ